MTNDRLYFDEVLLSDIIKELERSYDVKITVADDTLNTIRFYGNFRKKRAKHSGNYECIVIYR